MIQSFSSALGTRTVSTTTGWIGGRVHPVILVNDKARKHGISPFTVIRISLSRRLDSTAKTVPLFTQGLDSVDIFARGRICCLTLLFQGL